MCIWIGGFFKEAFDSKHIRENYHVTVLSDNCSDYWGKKINDIPVVSPEKLKYIENLVVIILIGNPLPIEKQLDEMGISWVTYTDLTIDDELEDIDVTYIKMDIEGAELNAIMGAKNTIIKNKSKLAVCVYHKTSDFWKIPAYIKTLNEDYSLYLRHHCNFNSWGTVLYAK